ncbi:MAG: hypothetical protein ACR2RV_08610 [Verrucomicrobiales bacterium]
MIERTLRMLGMARDCIVGIPVDAHGQLTAAVLGHELAQAADAPAIVLLQAVDLPTGSFDPYSEVIPVARRYDTWVPIDDAFELCFATPAGSSLKRRSFPVSRDCTSDILTRGDCPPPSSPYAPWGQRGQKSNFLAIRPAKYRVGSCQRIGRRSEWGRSSQPAWVNAWMKISVLER